MELLSKLFVVAVTAVAAAVGAVAAGVDGGGTTGSPTGALPIATPITPAPTTEPPGAPTAPAGDRMVLRVDRGVGGFTTIDWAFAQIPTFLLTDDGRVISPGPQIAIYPAPLLPALQYVQLSEADARAAVELARAAGVDEDFVDRTLIAVIADIGSTVIRLDVDGRVATTDVYGLGMAPEFLTPEVAARHAELVEFVDELTTRYASPAGAAGGVYEPEQFVVGVQPVDPAALDSSDVEPTVRPWPERLGDESAGCQVLDGDAVRAELATANQLTFFERSDGSLVKPLLRPLLPGSDGCPA